MKNRKLPCFSFLIKDSDSLTGDKLEKDNPKLLKKFHEKVRNSRQEVKFYTSAAHLNSLVLHTFQHAPQDTPAIGWMRANNISISTSSSNELVGAWELVSSNVPAWRGSRIIKMFSESEFMWIQLDGARCQAFNFGYYERDPYGIYIHEVPRETSFATIKNQSQHYGIQIEGDIRASAH